VTTQLFGVGIPVKLPPVCTPAADTANVAVVVAGLPDEQLMLKP
jgi:hypothetical protein